MKNVSAELKTFLDTSKTFHVCDLYELILQSGAVYRYADYGLPVLLDDGRLFASSNRPVFKRGKLKMNSRIEVDKLAVTLYIGGEDKIRLNTAQAKKRYRAAGRTSTSGRGR